MGLLILLALLAVAFLAGAAVEHHRAQADWRKWERQLARREVTRL